MTENDQPTEGHPANESHAQEDRGMIKALIGSGAPDLDPNQGLLAQMASVSGEAPPDAVQAAPAPEPSTPMATPQSSEADN